MRGVISLVDECGKTHWLNMEQMVAVVATERTVGGTYASHTSEQRLLVKMTTYPLEGPIVVKGEQAEQLRRVLQGLADQQGGAAA